MATIEATADHHGAARLLGRGRPVNADTGAEGTMSHKWRRMAGFTLAPGYPGVLAGVGLAVIAGLVCAVGPWWLPIGLMLGCGALALTALFPLAGLVLCFMLTFQAIPATVAPEIPLGFFKLKPYELIFVWTSFAFLMRAVFAPGTVKLEKPIFIMPMIFIFVCVVIGVIHSRYFQGNNELVIAEARGFLGLLVLPIVQWIVRDKQGVDRLSAWISASAVVLSVYVILQAVAGAHILDGRVESLDQGRNSDVTRSVIDGVYIQGFALYHMTLSLKSGRRIRLWLVPLILIVLLGLLATFTRGAWAAAAMGGLVAAFLAARWRGVFIAAAMGAIMVAGAVSAAYVLKPRVAEAAVERALGIGKELREGGSYGWRRIENEEAFRNIREHPLLGVGIGGMYKKVASSGATNFELEYYFIHNSYLFFPLKMGIFATLGPILIAAVLLLGLARIYRSTGGYVGTTAAVCAGTATMIFIGAVEGPHLKSFPGLLILGTVMALVAVAYRPMLGSRPPAGKSEDRPLSGRPPNQSIATAAP